MLGEKLRAEVDCLKIGRNIVFSEVTFRKANGIIVAKGKHTLSKLNHLKTENGQFVRQWSDFTLLAECQKTCKKALFSVQQKKVFSNGKFSTHSFFCWFAAFCSLVALIKGIFGCQVFSIIDVCFEFSYANNVCCERQKSREYWGPRTRGLLAHSTRHIHAPFDSFLRQLSIVFCLKNE